jgi:hypothetical protein
MSTSEVLQNIVGERKVPHPCYQQWGKCTRGAFSVFPTLDFSDIGRPTETRVYIWAVEGFACPVCSIACKCVILAAGYTRQSFPFTPERIIKPLSPRTREELMRPEILRRFDGAFQTWRTGRNYDGGYQSKTGVRCETQGQHRAKLGYAGSLIDCQTGTTL